VLSPPDQPDAEAITWPGTLIVREATLQDAFAALHAAGAEEAALLAADAPDLPPLLLGKLFRALGSAPSAACQSEDGGLVAFAARLPLPDWLAAALKDTDLDVPDALPRLRAAAPRHGQVPQGPSWHRLRTPEDLRFLDPGLEGWETTRALLEGHPLS
jgi:molybdopterin-guanine dinucleotide biosynthesis protein A